MAGENQNNDGQQFHKYQRKEQPLLTPQIIKGTTTSYSSDN